RPALAGVLALGVGLAIGALAFSSETSEKTETIRAIVVAPGRHATAELRKAGSHLELVVVGMPAPPPGRIYEVWLEHGTAAPLPTDALFSVTRAGSGSVGVPGNLHGVSKVLVTDEPLGGSLKPTRTPVILGSI
ncbi:MAG: anti-sigma factor domain-containing protein, partial [Solirubrobacteraceae bacterium]